MSMPISASQLGSCRTCGHPIVAHHGDTYRGPCTILLGAYGRGGTCPCTAGVRG